MTFEDSSVSRAARTAADAAAKASGVTVSAVAENDDLTTLSSTIDAVWGGLVPPANLLRGLALADSGLLLAARDGRPVGFALGFAGTRGGLHFHSHQVGVVASERSTGVGFALKLAQRAECLAVGITEMRWTFDPLLAANAWFNLQRLGARIVRFLPDCYGSRVDAFNTGERTDRVEVSWRLDAGPPAEPTLIADAVELVDPVGVRRTRATPRSGARIAVPTDHLSLRTADPTVARRWRDAVATALVDTFDAGYRITGFDRHAYLVAASDRLGSHQTGSHRSGSQHAGSRRAGERV